MAFWNAPMVAIDIGSSAIKLLELSGPSLSKIKTIGFSPLPPDSVANGIIKDPVAVEGTLKDLIKQLKVRTFARRAAFALGGSATIIKKINITTPTNMSELSDTVNLEAEQAFQYDINDLYFDYQVLVQGEIGTQTQILLVGAKRETVEQYISIFKAVGLKPGIIDCDVFAVVNMFEQSYGTLGGISAILNIGYASTQVTFLSNSSYLYNREIPIGGINYSKEMATVLQISLAEAEAIKVNMANNDYGSNPDVQRVIQEVNQQLVNEIQTSFDFFFQSGEAPPEQSSVHNVFLGGGGAKITGLDAAIAAHLQKPVSMVEPFQKLSTMESMKTNELLTMGPLFAVAAGLATRAGEDLRKGVA